ncbi:MAG: hypothetical protein ACRDNR_17605 [Gaiellaceae bacterium]
MFGEALPAIISGTFAAVVAVVAAFLSYWFGKRTLRQQLTDKLQEIGATGQQDRVTAEREYQLEAMKTFRATVGGPKGQIIESVHDLSDRLGQILRPESGVSTDRWELLRKSSPYLLTTSWLTLRPFVWIDILRGQMVFLDQTLGDLVDEEFRFLNYCRLLERALTERELFEGADYKWPELAQVFYNQLRFITEQLTTFGDSSTASISYSEFMQREPSPEVRGVMEFLQNAGARGRLGELRRARLIALYAASNFFLEHFRLPYRRFESAEKSIKYLDGISQARGDPIRENLQKLLSEQESLSPSII